MTNSVAWSSRLMMIMMRLFEESEICYCNTLDVALTELALFNFDKKKFRSWRWSIIVLSLFCSQMTALPEKNVSNLLSRMIVQYFFSIEVFSSSINLNLISRNQFTVIQYISAKSKDTLHSISIGFKAKKKKKFYSIRFSHLRCIIVVSLSFLKCSKSKPPINRDTMNWEGDLYSIVGV